MYYIQYHSVPSHPKDWQCSNRNNHPNHQQSAQQPHFKVKIATTRELSIEKEDQDPADYKVFLDGSGLNEGIGTAVVIYKRGISQPIGHLKAHLGSSTMHNIYEAELVGRILATWLIHITPGT